MVPGFPLPPGAGEGEEHTALWPVRSRSHSPLHCVLRSVCPRSLPGATRSRTNCLSSLTSGKRFCVARDQIVSPSTRTSNTPPVPGCIASSPSSAANVVKSSCAIHAARNNQRHWVQYWISTRGCLYMPWSFCVICLPSLLTLGEEVSSCPLRRFSDTV